MPDTAPLLRLCRFDELADPDSRGFAVQTAAGPEDIFIVRRGAQVFAYVNHCPHTGSPLDWLPDQFLSLDRRLIQCAMHAALFRIEDGRCVAGPCAGRALTPVSVTVEGGWILVRGERVL
ncbi:MAG: Rieske (2Fe-2S) protein [Gammaproteobacteria bacterium]|nr:Rieske (2Fe-2S) protein [Gammaproteobacteria bacterium]